MAGSGLRALGGQVAAIPYTWRWRPGHRICQPPSRNQSIPAQRTTTGVRPLLRPLARLTSFGGYVATGGTRSRASVATMPFSVERELDPPATRGDGALAIVSANRLPAISPFPRNARRRGRRRHGTIHYPTTHYQLNRNRKFPTIIYISTFLHGHSLNH